MMDEKTPALKKIFAVIPFSLWEELKRKDKLIGDFDSWMHDAIREKLDREAGN